jgi:hypothetical protein
MKIESIMRIMMMVEIVRGLMSCVAASCTPLLPAPMEDVDWRKTVPKRHSRQIVYPI